MEIQSHSNTELLQMLVGKKRAKALDGKSLAEVFGYSRQPGNAASDCVTPYGVDAELAAAKELIARCMQESITFNDALSSPGECRTFLSARMAHLEHEEFWVLYLDSHNRLIEAERLFRGTLSQTSVYPREVVKGALARNAAATIFSHNHPSGVAQESRADRALTEHLQKALEMVDVKVLDHFVVGGTQVLSFAEKGWI